jgi:hypothetical protein
MPLPWIWDSRLIEDKKKGQGRIGLALINDGLLAATGYRVGDYRLPR